LWKNVKPSINIIKDFEKTYPDEETDFIKPEILDVRPIHVITAITEDTPFSKVGKVFQNDEEKSEESIDVEQGERRE
jgi:hypothetical protein